MLLILNAHALDGYSSHFVCLCVTLILKKTPFSGLSLHQYNLGDDLSPLNVKIEAILEKKRVKLRP